MQKSKKNRSQARRNINRRNFLRIERLEDRMVLTGSVPIAVNDSFHLLPDQPLDISAPGILANDTDAEGDVLTAALFSGPAHGTLTLDPAGSFEYTPDSAFSGIDSFMYFANDGTGHSLLAAVTLRVGGDSAPVSQDDSFTVNEDEVLTILASAGVLHNDSDPDGDSLTAALVTGPTNGDVSLAADGSFVYTPAPNFHGTDSFIYQASDGANSGNLATVTITVSSVNDAPIASNDSFSLDEDTTLNISGPGVMANDSDADGDPLAATLVNPPLHGSLDLAADGSFTYTPDANFNGVDGFSYLVSDGIALSSVATVTLEVNAVNDAPVAANDEYQTDEDTPLAVDAAAGLLGNDTDVDGDSLTASLVSGPAHGTLTLNGDGSFLYTPDANFNGVDGFSYVVSDGTTESEVAGVTLNVNAVNDPPLALNDEYTIDEDTSLTLPAPGILGNDSDPDGDPLTASLVSGPLHGTLSLAADGSLTYTPEANFNGTDGFSYLANDGAADSEVATVTINVNSVDDPPLAANDEYTTDEDTPLTVDAADGLLANDSDPDSSSLSVTMVSGPVHGTVALNADGSFTYTPSADYNGVDGFSYTAGDGTLDSDVATVTINVNPVEDAPVAADDAFTTDEDTPLVVDLSSGVLANDSDVDGDAMTATLVSGPAHGTLTLNADGSFNYAPEADFNGDDSFIYTASDGTLTSGEATVSITVNPVNDAPLAAGDEFTTDEDTSLHVDAPGLLANDSDPDGDPLSTVLVSGPANGTLSLNADGSFDYVPGTDFNGDDSFVYQASDGSLVSIETTVTIHVTAVNDAPVATDDTFTTDEDTPLVVDVPSGVLANDSDVDGDTLTATLVSGPAHGTLTLNADGSFNYSPEADFNGNDSFIYTASDGTLTSGEATVSITVNPVNDAPLAAGDEFTTDEDTSLHVDAPGLLANDSDPDGDPLSTVLVSGPANGALSLNADGSFDYVPGTDFNGDDSFVYQASDGSLVSIETTVTIHVTAVNDAPVATDDAFSTDEDTPLVVDVPSGVLANDSDVDGDTLTATLVSGPAHGTLTLNADGSFNYAPEANFNGNDSFIYTASDGTLSSNEATVSISVNSENDAPVAAGDEFTTDEDTSLHVDAPGLLANDSDPDGDPLSALLVSGPANGALSLNADGSFDYYPGANFNGDDSFVYQASDGSLVSDETTVTIHVTPVNDLPSAADDAFNTDEDTPLVVDVPSGVLANDSDVDGDTLTATLVSGPAHGTLTLNADGSFNYAPEANFNGNDSFIYTASDGTLSSNEATVSISVNSENDAPVAAGDEFTTDEDTSLHVDAPGLLANDSDPDGDPLSALLVSGPANGALSLNADGSFDYVPGTDFNGDDSFVYQASDGSLVSIETTVTIHVTAVNDAPVAADDTFTTDEDTPLVVDVPSGVLANDSDVDGDALTATLVSGPAHGILTLNADGSFNYSPEADFNGDDSFAYTASDGTLASNEATVSITVNPVNDAPLAAGDEFTTDEDTSLHVDAPGLLANDSDPEGDTLTSVLVSGPANGALSLNADGSFDYVPGTDFNGDDSFVYQASDGSLVSAETTVTIHVTAVNDAPVAEGDAFSTDANTSLTIDAPGVLVNDSDVDGDPLSAALVNGPAHGTVSLAADGSFTYVPAANFSGDDSFTYQASDGSLQSGETTVSITVNPAPDAPVAHSDSYSTGEDAILTASAGMGVLANDFDPLDAPLTAELVGGPTNGTLTLNSDGSFTYAPGANFYGTDSFTYVANNGTSTSSVMTATIVVQPLNDAPVAVNDDYNADAGGNVDATVATGVLANDSDADGDPLAVTLLWGPAHGSLTLNSDGSFSYSAAAGFVGTDSFKYQLSDGMSNSNVATVTLHIGQPDPNSPPVSQDDDFVVDAGSSLTVDAPGVLGNDTDANGDALTAALASGPAHGTLTLNADGSLTYTPEDGFVGTDSFTYTASDGQDSGNVATVTIAVQDPSQNHNPVANDDAYAATAETLLSVPASQGVLANDTDADGDPLTAVLVTGAAHGNVTLNPDGSFDYQPQTGFTGTDTFTYQAADGIGLSAVATVTINVGSAANHRPVAVNDHYATTVDQPLSVDAPGLLGNDSDPDGNPLTAELFGGPQHGTIELNSDGSFVYTPAAGFQGKDSFIYRTFDGEVHSALAAVTIYVNAAPSA